MSAYQLNTTPVEEKREELNPLMGEIISQGLCVNCINRNDCNYLARASAPIHTCELYECGGETYPRPVPVTQPDNPVQLVSGDTVPRGLCVNCDNLEHCGFNKPLSGVWHCEEYC